MLAAWNRHGVTLRPLFASLLVAATISNLPAQSTAIRIWGHGSRNGNSVGNLVGLWNRDFTRTHPGTHFDVSLSGDSAAMGGLYTGAADMALMGREIWPIEQEGFEQASGHKPLEISVMTGSLDVPRHSFALVIYVHKNNPLSKLTLAQVDAVFVADHRWGPANIRTWGDLGLSGGWAAQSLNLYGFAIQQDFSQFFQQAIMGGSKKWNCNLHEFRDRGSVDAGQQILDALARDRYGIAISSLAYRNPNTKVMALAAPADDYVMPTRETVVARQYPLARPVSIVVNRDPAAPLDSRIKDYLTYVLSRDGQQRVVQDGGYLPLPEVIAEQEKMKLQ